MESDGSGDLASRRYRQLSGLGQEFELRQIVQRMAAAIAGGATHQRRGLQPGAERRPLGSAEQAAAVRIVELHTAHPGRFATGHAGDGAGD